MTTTIETDMRASVQAVAEAGVAAGYWTIVDPQPEDYMRDGSSRVWVTSKAGDRWTINAGGYGRERTVYADIPSMTKGAFHAGARFDVARCAASRPAEAIAKDLSRRAINSTEGAEAIAAMRARLGDQLAARVALLKVIEDVGRRFGYRPVNLSDTATDEATLYAPGKPGIRVSRHGTVHLLHTPTFKLADLPLVIGMLSS